MIQMQKVYRKMDDLGYAEATIGTRYFREAVEIAATQARAMMCKDVYPTIAARHGCKPGDVERAMRTATEKARRGPLWEWAWREMGGVNAPTNSEVIWRLVRECTDEN